MTLSIVKEPTLTKEQIREIEALIDRCNREDRTKYVFDADDDFKKEGDVNAFLLYGDDQLIGCISVFAPMKSEAELLAFTDPDHRRRGYFRRLLAEAVAELKRREIGSLLFVCDHNSASGENAARNLGARYEYSEFLMTYPGRERPRISPDERILIVEAAQEHRNRLIEINRSAFPGHGEEAPHIIDEFYESDRRRLFTILFEEKIVGMIGIYQDINKKYLHGFCIDGEYRGRGIGGQVLSSMVVRCLEEQENGAIELEVQTDNENALQLYKKVGFEVVTEFRYHRGSLTGGDLE